MLYHVYKACIQVLCPLLLDTKVSNRKLVNQWVRIAFRSQALNTSHLMLLTFLGFHTPDSIRLIENYQPRIDEMHYQMGIAALYNYHQDIISPEQIKELHPLVNIDGIYAGGHVRELASG